MIDRKTTFSPDRRYRYTLWREWGPITTQNLFTEDPHLDYYLGRGTDYVQFIGLNPSTADEAKDDPTIRKCIGFAKRWGFRGLCMTNLFAFRATDPRKMMGATHPIGPDNDRWLTATVEQVTLVVAAWGTKGQFLGRDEEVMKLIDSMKCIKLTTEGHPQHPLYVPYSESSKDFLLA